MDKTEYDYSEFAVIKETKVVDGATKVINSLDIYPARMCSDKKGGFWVLSTNQDNIGATTGDFRLKHVKNDGTYEVIVKDYWGNATGIEDSGMKKLSKYSNDIDVNIDGTEITIAICGSLATYKVTFDESGDVTVDSGTATVRGASSSTSPCGRDGNSLHPATTGVAYDVAGNLYATDLSGYFQAFAPVKADNSYTTVANEAVVVTADTMTGVADVAVDANVPVEYYNLQGVKVANPENGIFVKKQGGKATKVVL